MPSPHSIDSEIAMKQSPRSFDIGINEKIFSETDELESLSERSQNGLYHTQPPNVNERKCMDRWTELLFFVLLLTVASSLGWVLLDGMTLSIKSLFHFHVLFGVLFGFVIFPFGAVVFRYFTNITKPTAKIIHGTIMGVTACLMIVTAYFMIQAKEMTNTPHFTTLHDWISIVTIIFMAAQLIVAIITFSFDIVPVEYKMKIRDIHAVVGISMQILLLQGLFYAVGRIFSKPKPTAIVWLGNTTAILCTIGVLLACYVLIVPHYQRKNAKID